MWKPIILQNNFNNRNKIGKQKNLKRRKRGEQILQPNAFLIQVRLSNVYQRPDYSET